MDYTTDPGPIVEGFLRDQHAATQTTILDAALEWAAVKFCADLRECASKPADPVLVERHTALIATTKEAVDRSDRFAAKLAEPPVANDGARRAVLIERVTQIEGEHAAHAALAAIADEIGSDAEAEQHLAVMLELDGFHAAVLAELAALTLEPDSEE